jgi:hypothetical protein
MNASAAPTRPRRILSLLLATLLLSAFSLAGEPPAEPDRNTISAAAPMTLEVEGSGAHGQLVVAPELVGPDAGAELIYAIVGAPLHGRVGLAGGDEGDLFRTQTSRLGYFAYRPREGFAGEDSFTYTVRNATTGLTFRNTVVLTVLPPPPVVLEKFEVGAARARPPQVRAVALVTRPNTPVSAQLPSHEDAMAPADRALIPAPKVAYVLDAKNAPRNGVARLDRSTGQLTYAPHPGFIGEERFGYYTVDEHNPHLGAERSVVVSVEPIRRGRELSVDRSRSREVDLVFVINNSPSMGKHQERLVATLARFRQLFHARDLDYRIGVLTTDFVNADPSRGPGQQRFYKEMRAVRLDAAGNPVTDARGRPQTFTKRVASNGLLVTLPELPEPWVTPRTPDGVFAELAQVGTNGDSNRTAFTATYNFVAGYHNGDHAFLRPEAPTFVVFFMDEEETRMATWKEQAGGAPRAEWIEDGQLPALLDAFNARAPAAARQTLEGYINQWVLRPFIIAKGNRRGRLEIHAVVAPGNVSHRRAAELTGGAVLNIEEDFSGPLAALGDRIADTVAVALEPVEGGATLYRKSLRVLVDGREVASDPRDGWVYDEQTHRIRFEGIAKRRAFLARIDIRYEEHR